ncbi:MAG: EVE domain-containing protein, partial [Ginsengibacter sp.]
DWIVYYSSKDKFENGKPLQKFTAVGQVIDDETYQPNTHSEFKPYRRNVKYKKHREADIRPLIDKLSFIKNKKRWGFYLISGFREIVKDDFDIIEGAMKQGKLKT